LHSPNSIAHFHTPDSIALDQTPINKPADMSSTLNTRGRDIPDEIVEMILARTLPRVGEGLNLQQKSFYGPGANVANVSRAFRGIINDLRHKRLDDRGKRGRYMNMKLRRQPIAASDWVQIRGEAGDAAAHPLFQDQNAACQLLVTMLAEILDADDGLTIPVARAIEQRPGDRQQLLFELSDKVGVWDHAEEYVRYRRLRGHRPFVVNPPSRQSLWFKNLQEMETYFTVGPGGIGVGAADMRHITFVGVGYTDDKEEEEDHFRAAWGAFEALLEATRRMSLEMLQVDCLLGGGPVLGPDSRGMWSMMKLRGLKDVFLTGWYWHDLDFNRHVREVMTSPAGTPWQPHGQELPDDAGWEVARHEPHEQQVRYLEGRYRDTQCWEVICERRRVETERLKKEKERLKRENKEKQAYRKKWLKRLRPRRQRKKEDDEAVREGWLQRLRPRKRAPKS
jgi:hypothetical protein